VKEPAMKKALLILTVSVFVAASIVTAATAGKASVSKDGDYTVDTYFTTSAAGVRTNVNVYASDGLTKVPGSPAELSRPLSVFILQKDMATDEILLDVNAYVQLDPGDLVIDPQIRRARLHEVVEGVEGVSGRTVEIAVDLEVRGIGPIERAHQRFRFVDEEMILNGHANSRVRMAEVRASLSIDGVEYTPEPGFFAYMSRSTGGAVTITR
jgi:hypothetical protein